MSVKFEKSDGRIFDSRECFRNLNLLAHAQLIERSIGSVCGGHGHCGKDRIQILDKKMRSKLSPVTECEKKHLTPKELEAGWRLGCQSYPEENDLEIVVRF